MSDLDSLGRRHARNVHQALADSEPPPVESLERRSDKRPEPGWGRGIWVAVAAAITVVVLAIPVVLLTTGNGNPVESPVATSPAVSGSDDSVFEPPSTPVDGGVVFQMTFLDGSQFWLMLPESIASDVAGFVPGGAVGWDDVGTCCGRSLEIRRGSIEDFYGDREPDVVYEDAAGRPVHFYKNPDGLDHIVFQIGGWVIEAWDGGTGRPSDQFSKEQRSQFASLFDGYVDEEGFLVLTPADPMTVRPTDSPDGRLIAEDGETQVGVIKDRVCGNVPLSVTSRGYSYHSDQQSGLTALCSPEDSSVVWVNRTDLTEAELDLIQWTSDSDTLTGNTPPAELEEVPEWCPVTVPGAIAFTPLSEAPEGPPSVYDEVWYGTPELWTMINPQGEINSKR